MLVTVSSTGVALPALDARLMEELPFRRNVQRLPLFGLGCAGGVLGLARAAACASAQPGSRILYLVVELCTLTFCGSDRTTANVVATALFGDGAAGAVLTTDGTGPAMRSACGGTTGRPAASAPFAFVSVLSRESWGLPPSAAASPASAFPQRRLL